MLEGIRNLLAAVQFIFYGNGLLKKCFAHLQEQHLLSCMCQFDDSPTHSTSLAGRVETGAGISKAYAQTVNHPRLSDILH